ncbi:hypothetical protein EC973_008100 [Apophysomyces ossiformis]|uniref:Methyltransferase domain-containing protein n=1 Tax=Apophysomyces ossiformis TaxID=679940 RepID=A0A8H7EPD6_9FUNG|nr:hypothetical protein EC973_008100 [Apophysomyces ossiformis]
MKQSDLRLSDAAHEDRLLSHWFATDNEEQDRMISTHYALKSFFGGNVLDAVKHCLPFEQGIKILDIGCSSGAWVLDMSLEFPHCEFHGVDVATFVRKGGLPGNVKFHQGDVLQKLDFADDTFDFVHMRNMLFAFEVKDWPIAVREALRVTKPGGVLQLLEMDIRELQCNDKLRRTYELFYSICQSQHQDPRMAVQLENILRQAGADILQIDERMINCASMPGLAKKRLLWDIERGLECMISVMGPHLELNGTEAQKELVEEIIQSITDADYESSYKGVACQKKVKKIK